MDAYEKAINEKNRLDAMAEQVSQVRGMTEEEREEFSHQLGVFMCEMLTEDEVLDAVGDVENMYWRAETGKRIVKRYETEVNITIEQQDVDVFANSTILALRKAIDGEKAERTVRRIKSAKNASRNMPST